MMTLIDTSAWIEFLRAKGHAVIKARVADLISSRRAAYTCPVRFELLLGRRAQELHDVQIGLGFAHRIVLAPQHWDSATGLGEKLRSFGHNIPISDLLVAIVAVDRNLPLLAYDEHFTLIRTELLPKLHLVS